MRLTTLLTLCVLGLWASDRARAQKIDARKTKAFSIKSGTVASGATRAKTKTGPKSIDFEREKARQAALARNEAQQSEKRQKMIQLIERVLKSRTYKLRRFRAQRSQYLMRKANLEFEEDRYQNLLRYQRYEQAMTAFDAGKTKVRPQEPKAQYSTAIQTFRQLVAEDPDCLRCDEARFRLGYCLNQGGKSAAAAKVLSALVARHPSSPYAADAYLLMGEVWFDANKFIAAMGNYQMVFRRFPKSLMAGYAEYKYAWSVYHQAKYQEAVKALHSVVRHRKARLKKQALGDLVTFYAELKDGWILARQYFTRIGGLKLALLHLWRMARFLDAQDKNEPSLKVIAWLLAKNPSSPRATDYHQLKVDILVRLKDPQRLDAGLQKIVTFYEPDSPWMRAHAANPQLQAAGRRLAEKAMAYVATYYHREGKAAGKEDLLRRAASKYRAFLKQFPRSGQTTNMAFYLAELLRQFADYSDAAKFYGLVAEDTKTKFREDAAFQRVFCLARLLASKGLDRPVPRSVGTQEIPKTALQPLEKRFVSASDTFARSFPKSKDTPSVLFKAARIFYEHGYLNKAGDRFATVVTGHPKDRYAALSGAMALDSFSRLKDWPNVVKWARHLIKIRNFQHYKRLALRSIIAASGIKAAGILEGRKKYAEAAQAMLAVYTEFPRDKNAQRALYNTAVLWEKAGKTERAIKLYKKVRKIARRTEFASRSTFVLGALYEGRANFTQAAKYYGEMAKLKKIAQTPDALYNASVMNEAIGRYRDAERIRRLYVKLYPKRADAAKAYFSIGKLLESQKKWKAAESFYLKFVKDGKLTAKHPTLEVAAWTRAGRTIRKSKLGAQQRGQTIALAHFSRAIKAFARRKLRPGSLAAAYAGWARFQLAEVVFDQFEAVTLSGSGGKLVTLLIKKAKLREKAQKLYQSVLPYKALVWSTAAVYKIGMLYARTVEALYAIPVPKSITKPAEREEYKAALQMKAQPVEDAALKAFRKAVAVAHRLRVYNRFTIRAAQRLLKYDPDRFPNPGRKVLEGGHDEPLRGAQPDLSEGGLP
ncbi:MAG: tetratricopeptide repeat protein [bacterium]